MSTLSDLSRIFPTLDAALISGIWTAAKGDFGKAHTACTALAAPAVSAAPPLSRKRTSSLRKEAEVVDKDATVELAEEAAIVEPAKKAKSAAVVGKARPMCSFGPGCYRKTKKHLAEAAHPGDADWIVAEVEVAPEVVVAPVAAPLTRKRTASLSAAAAAPPVVPAKASKPVRPKCPFGPECYRKNKQHRVEQAHPGDADWTAADDKEIATALARSASLALHPPSSPDTVAFDEDGGADAQEFVDRMLAFQKGEPYVPPAKLAKPAKATPAKATPAAKAKAPAGKIHAGRVFALTGAMSKVRTEIVREIESRGGEVKASVTGTVTHLIAADPHSGSSKLEKARAAGIIVVGEAFIYSGDEASTKLPETTGDEDDDDYEEAGGAPPAWLVAEVTCKGVVPKHCMKSGETTMAGPYTLKRVHDHYYCTCTSWKQQKASVDARTCKHLREHLGAEYEAARVHGGGDASAASGVVRASDTTHDAAHDVKVPAPALLLANKWSESSDPTGWHMSEKLDGVRAFWTKGMLVSRNGNKFFAPAWFTEKLPKDVELDGELFAGRGKFQQAVSIARTHDSARWGELTYQVFDVPALKAPFEARMSKLAELLGAGKCGAHVQLVQQTVCRSREHLLEQLKATELLKGEGLMLRQPRSLYVGSRSSTLLKVKTFHDADARVVAHEPGKGKYAGQCGALKCVLLDSGKEFRCGSGMSDADRVNPPPVGSVIIFRYFEMTPDGVPRFPSYVGVRAD